MGGEASAIDGEIPATAKLQLSAPALRRPLTQVLMVLFGALILLWPAYVNGGPFWFPDTSNYIRAADAASVVITDRKSVWSDRLIYVPMEEASRSERSSEESQTPVENSGSLIVPTRPVISGRSIYYGFLLYVPMQIIGTWGGVILQSLIVSFLLLKCLSIALRQFNSEETWRVLTIFGVLVALTPLPYFTSMLMPDVYSGIIVLTMGTLICFWPQLSVKDRALLLGASAMIITFHTTHILIVAAMALGAAIFCFRGVRRLRPVLLSAPILLTAVLAAMAFSTAVEMRLGQKPMSPPFLSARLTASGPGTTYLKETCGDASTRQFALCTFRDRLPLDSDSFLWDHNSRRGVFQIAQPKLQRQISAEDKAFFVAVFLDNPVAVSGALMESVAETFRLADLNNFNYPTGTGIAEKVPDSIAREIYDSRAYKRIMPTGFTVASTVWTAALSMIVIFVFIIYSLSQADVTLSRLRRYAFLIALAFVANGVVCGALSKATARYQMRLIWLLPAAALVSVSGWKSSTMRASEAER